MSSFLAEFLLSKLDSVSVGYRSPMRKASLPHHPVVYVVVNRATSEALYVGATKSLYERWHQHHCNYEFSKVKDGLKILWLPTAMQDLAGMEQSFMVLFRPTLNRTRQRYFAQLSGV